MKRAPKRFDTPMPPKRTTLDKPPSWVRRTLERIRAMKLDDKETKA